MFDQIVGNERVKDTLRRMIAARRVPGALLFAGEDGVGKKLFALELAKALNCRSPHVEAEACDSCSSCVRAALLDWPARDETEANKQILWTAHPDIGIVRPAGRFIKVDQMREVEREANFRPFEGAARIFLIEEADLLHESAANALLKTLEEPPATSHLILITSRPAALLPTVRSRCQIIRFAPLTIVQIEDYLRAQERKLSDADVHLLARVVRGSIGRAIKINLDDYRQRRAAMLEVLASLTTAPDRSRLLRAAEELTDAKRKDEYEPRLEVLEMLIRDVWQLALGASVEQTVNEDLRRELMQISERVTNARASAWLMRLETLRSQFLVNINRKVATDALFLAMAEN
jgi:DNA polymerase-3 subunit delta'